MSNVSRRGALPRLRLGGQKAELALAASSPPHSLALSLSLFGRSASAGAGEGASAELKAKKMGSPSGGREFHRPLVNENLKNIHLETSWCFSQTELVLGRVGDLGSGNFCCTFTFAVQSS